MTTNTTKPDKHNLAIEGLSKTYQMGESEVHALQDVSLSIGEGEY